MYNIPEIIVGFSRGNSGSFFLHPAVHKTVNPTDFSDKFQVHAILPSLGIAHDNVYDAGRRSVGIDHRIDLSVSIHLVGLSRRQYTGD